MDTMKTRSKIHNDAPPNDLRNPNVGPKMKQPKKIKAHSLAHNTFRVEKHVITLRWD